LYTVSAAALEVLSVKLSGRVLPLEFSKFCLLLVSKYALRRVEMKGRVRWGRGVEMKRRVRWGDEGGNDGTTATVSRRLTEKILGLFVLFFM